MYAPGHITREDEAQIPSFNSHAEARAWFKDKYGDAFQLFETNTVDGVEWYFYYLILDREVFKQGQAELKEGKMMSDPMKFLGSHQSIEINQHGHIHVVH